jgi:C-terminal processing protease CtpA/Prc
MAGKSHDEVIECLVAQQQVELEVLREKVTRRLTTTIQKGNARLGMLIGTREGLRWAYIKSIAEGGAVHQNGVLEVNDLLFAVNGVPLEGKNHEEVVQLLSSAGDVVTLEAIREDYPKEILAMLRVEPEVKTEWGRGKCSVWWCGGGEQIGPSR